MSSPDVPIRDQDLSGIVANEPTLGLHTAKVLFWKTSGIYGLPSHSHRLRMR
jgi:hypothetical protein